MDDTHETGLEQTSYPMSIGYACIAVAVPGSGMKTCTLKYASEERLLALIEHNLVSLERVIDYNIRSGILLFRISSELIPFGSSLAEALPWRSLFVEKLADIGGKITHAGMRVSMHPGQYTVLNSPEGTVTERALRDLRYHAGVLDALGLGGEHKIILHLGGVYGNKREAINRLTARCRELEPAVRKRLVLENDDKLFHIGDVLDASAAAGLPVLYDTLHNAVNPADAGRTDADWIAQCASSWKKGDGRQKIHYSQQHEGKKQGAHSGSIGIDAFLDFFGQLAGMDLDIMLEVKDKNLSALKCIHCVSNRGAGALEAEWARYKYAVLERSPEIYGEIRRLLCDKAAYPALKMYRLIEAASAQPVSDGNAVNAAQHVWGYFKDKAMDTERERFNRILLQYRMAGTGLQAIKRFLQRLALKYGQDYLLYGYYFSNIDTNQY